MKSHLGWIFAHVRNPVNYTVVPKGDGLSAVMVRNAKLVAMIQSNLAVSNIKGYFFWDTTMYNITSLQSFPATKSEQKTNNG